MAQRERHRWSLQKGFLRNIHQENTSAYTVVIPTLNAENTIGMLLSALLQQTVKPEEIMVVDSQSEDRTASIAREAGGNRSRD